MVIARSFTIPVVGCIALFAAVTADNSRAARITVDPDDFAAGADISLAFPGVVLSAFGSGSLNGPDVSTPQVFSRFSTLASTGSRVFGNATYSNLWFSDSAEFRADFARPTNFVSLDLIADDGFDPSVLRAFDVSGTMLEQASVSGSAGPGVVETASIMRNRAEIAYVVATNPSGMAGQQFLIDRLIYDSTPFRARWQFDPAEPYTYFPDQRVPSRATTVQAPEPTSMSLLAAALLSCAAWLAPGRFRRKLTP